MARTITAKDLGIDVSRGGEHALFKWLIASFLFGKRIQQDIAEQAWRVLMEKHGRDTPRKLGNCTHRQLVQMLGEGHYSRYDESTAERLLALCGKLNEEYGGRVGGIHDASDNRADFEKRLAAFKGIGPKTVEIFMRDVAPLWYGRSAA